MTAWHDSLPVRVSFLGLLLGGVYWIFVSLPALLQSSLFAEFPIVTPLVAVFGYLTAVHAVADRLHKCCADLNEGRNAPAK